MRREGRPRLYIDAPKLSNSVDARLSEIAEMEQPQRLIEDLAAEVGGKKIRFDAATAPAKLVDIVRANGGTPDIGVDPIALMKARKNERELAGVNAAHLRDGIALVHPERAHIITPAGVNPLSFCRGSRRGGISVV